MNDCKIRPAKPHDFQRILALNLAAIKATSEMDLPHLQNLHAWSDYHKVVIHQDQVVAFLLVLSAGQAYQSPNYRWFNQHFPSFYYVDRIVVDAAMTGKKIGSLLYQDLFTTAKTVGIELIACEYNIKPLNTASQIFHQRFGFTEVATQWLDEHSKQVSLQVAEVSKYKEGS
ncbi:GNAT family N-acetyltransferase [Marinicella litoralis]|uniref:N-acetyltransferase domain-containing protein n=1 Tax=Marinicella litoralis TaxID=644220 RepID=A0A4R6XZ59_9GAMM|nr:GNAT family N-acetyltransferase [Marinicella litoralis]TDR23567.1 hypothetical protein C8D91_0430 [Marinicella litoralis]